MFSIAEIDLKEWLALSPLYLTVAVVCFGVGGIHWWARYRIARNCLGVPLAGIRLSPRWRWMGLWIQLMLLVLLVLLAVRPLTGMSEQWGPMVAFGAISGLGLLLGLGQWRLRVYVCANGVTGWSAWGWPRFQSWERLRRIEAAALSGSYRLVGLGAPLYIPMVLEDDEALRALIRQYAPQVEWVIPTDVSAEQLLELQHWEGLNKAAPYLVTGTGVMLLWSMLVLSPYWYAMMLSAVAGMLMAAYPAFANLQPQHPKWLAHALQFGGVFGGSFLGSRIDPDVATAGLMALLAVLQPLLAMVFSAALLLLVTAAVGPQRNGRDADS